MKNIQIIDGAENCVYDIFSVPDEYFDMIFPDQTDIAFIDEVYERCSSNAEDLDVIFAEIWKQPLKKSDANGIHGILYYDMDHKKIYYPTRKDSEAINPGGVHLR